MKCKFCLDKRRLEILSVAVFGILLLLDLVILLALGKIFKKIYKLCCNHFPDDVTLRLVHNMSF